VYQADVMLAKRMNGQSADTRIAELRRFRASGYVEGAIQRNLIDAATASKMMQAGYADADLCNQTLLQCGQEAAERANRNVDPDQNEETAKRMYVASRFGLPPCI
jgi:hypothetical protein